MVPGNQIWFVMDDIDLRPGLDPAQNDSHDFGISAEEIIPEDGIMTT